MTLEEWQAAVREVTELLGEPDPWPTPTPPKGGTGARRLDNYSAMASYLRLVALVDDIQKADR